MIIHHTGDERVLPKLCGTDTELGNFVLGVESAACTDYYASRAILAAIKGYPERRRGLFDRYRSQDFTDHTAASAMEKAYGNASGWYANPQDVDRRFLAENGSAAYVDLDHIEICSGEVLGAFDLVAAGHAMLRIARAAQRKANEAGTSHIQVLVNNSDGLGNSYGSHINFLLSRAAYNDIFFHKPHYLAYLASFQISCILMGAGKIGAENGRPGVPYQLSARADFFERVQGIETTLNRPICNTRNEPLCGISPLRDPTAPARLHVIFFDSPLAHGSALFRAGLMQMTLAAIERGRINPRLILDHPLQALHSFSHDPTLAATASLIGGDRVNIVELQSAYLEDARRLCDEGVFEGVVPRASEIISLWEDTVTKFASGDILSLAPRLDWVMKLMAIERALDENHHLDWDSPEIKMIDHLYSNLDGGLFFTYQGSGFTERLVPDELIDHFVSNPPADTRAWTRAMLLRRAAEEAVEIDFVDWDRITFRLRGRNGWHTYRMLETANPLGWTRAEAGPLFAAGYDFPSLLDALDQLGKSPATFASSENNQYTTGGDRNALSQGPQ